MISVCMATYNGELFLKKQIDSILCQLNSDDELIISDDGSTDKTIEIINNYNDSRIKLFSNNSYCYTSNFENSLKHAKGDFIFLSDQDDVWLDGRISRTIKLLRDNDLVICNAKIVDKNLKIISESRNDLLSIKKGFMRNFIKTKYLGCCMAFTKSVLESCIPFPSNHDLCLHDAWISLFCEFKYKTYLDDTPLILYRRHENTTSNGSIGRTNKVSRILKIRLYLIFNIIKRTIKKESHKT